MNLCLISLLGPILEIEGDCLLNVILAVDLDVKVLEHEVSLTTVLVPHEDENLRKFIGL